MIYLVETNRDSWLLAASLYRDLRAKGITLPPVDATISAVALQNYMPLFSRDAHFEEVAKVTGLRLFQRVIAAV